MSERNEDHDRSLQVEEPPERSRFDIVHSGRERKGYLGGSSHSVPQGRSQPGYLRRRSCPSRQWRHIRGRYDHGSRRFEAGVLVRPNQQHPGDTFELVVIVRGYQRDGRRGEISQRWGGICVGYAAVEKRPETSVWSFARSLVPVSSIFVSSCYCSPVGRARC